MFQNFTFMAPTCDKTLRLWKKMHSNNTKESLQDEVHSRKRKLLKECYWKSEMSFANFFCSFERQILQKQNKNIYWDFPVNVSNSEVSAFFKARNFERNFCTCRGSANSSQILHKAFVQIVSAFSWETLYFIKLGSNILRKRHICAKRQFNYKLTFLTALFGMTTRAQPREYHVCITW